MHAAGLGWQLVLLVFVSDSLAQVEGALPLLFVPVLILVEHIQVLECGLKLGLDLMRVVSCEHSGGFREESGLVEVVKQARVVCLLAFFTLTHVDAPSVCAAVHLLVGLFLLLLSFLFLLDNVLAMREFLLDLLIGSDWARGHPWVSDDIHQSESHVGAVLQHVGNQVLELLPKEVLRLIAAVVLPEEICPVCDQQLVVGVVLVSLLKWRMSSVHDEQDDAESEQINLITLVLIFSDQFRRHVGNCTELSVQVTAAITALQRRCETEVCNLNIEFVAQ